MTNSIRAQFHHDECGFGRQPFIHDGERLPISLAAVASRFFQDSTYNFYNDEYGFGRQPFYHQVPTAPVVGSGVPREMHPHLSTMIAGASSGALKGLCAHPFDAKTFSAQKGVNISLLEGLKRPGLVGGTINSTGRNALSVLTTYQVYMLSKSQLMASLASGAFDSLLTPIASARQLVLTKEESNFINAFRNRGLAGLTKGCFPATLGRNMIYSLLYCPLTSELAKQMDHSLPSIVLAGAVAGTFATVFSFPLETIRYRQAQAFKSEKKSIPMLISEIWKELGYKGFYKGFLPSLQRQMVIGSALSLGMHAAMGNKRPAKDS